MKPHVVLYFSVVHIVIMESYLFRAHCYQGLAGMPPGSLFAQGAMYFRPEPCFTSSQVRGGEGLNLGFQANMLTSCVVFSVEMCREAEKCSSGMMDCLPFTKKERVDIPPGGA